MNKLNCVLIKDDIVELLQEVEQQLSTGVICCKCKNQCEKNSKCAVSMKNLLTDIRLFKDFYIERNPKETNPKEEVMKDVMNSITDTI